MADADEAADVFALPDLWGSSRWLGSDPDSDLVTTDFFSLDLKDLESRSSVNRVCAADDGFFKGPAFDPPAHEEAFSDDTCTDDLESTLDVDSASEDDVWISLREPDPKTPDYKTWDAFNSKRPPQYPPLCITEAGPGPYDALLTWKPDPLGLANIGHTIVDTRVYLSALTDAVLGRQSVLFSWPDGAKSFKTTVSEMRISGCTSNVLRGLESLCLRCGAVARSLGAFVDLTYSQHSSRCRIALANAVDVSVKAIQASITFGRRDVRTLLQLQCTVRKVSALLGQLHALVSTIRPGHGDEDIISIVFREAQTADYNGEYHRNTAREILQRVSQPWLDFLEEWIGTKPDAAFQLTRDMLGNRRFFVAVEPETYLDDFGQEMEEVDFRLDKEKFPDFIPNEVMDSLFETGKNLRFIRSTHPDHPISRGEIFSAGAPPRMTWLYDWGAILRLEKSASQYQGSLITSLSTAQRHTNTAGHAARQTWRTPQQTPDRDIFGAEAGKIESQILASMQELEQPLKQIDRDDDLSRGIRDYLAAENAAPDTAEAEFSPHWSLLATVSFGPLVSAQGSVVNREGLRLLFSAHHLRGHLRLQRDFHLFGNGFFSSRLSHALFDPSLETTERVPGVARQGGAMGLRLGGRDNWPPASSELRLALMGVLAESYSPYDHCGQQSHDLTERGGDLPGGLSFAVRDMPQEAVDKCLDADSLEALDFLRLSYKPPPPLAPVFTPIILMHYDCIFKLMLRVLRLQFVVNQVWRETTCLRLAQRSPHDVSVRFNYEARHFVAGLGSYFTDVGIAVPWRAFEKWLDTVQAELGEDLSTNRPGTAQSPERLRICHSLVLDQIMSRLLLRRRQQPVLQLLEEVFGIILQYSKVVSRRAGPGSGLTDGDHEIAELYKAFRKKAELFFTVCKGLAEKGEFGSRQGGGATVDEARASLGGSFGENTIDQLLSRLDMFGYYVKGSYEGEYR